MWFSWKWICGSLEKQWMKWMTNDNVEGVMPDSNGTVGSVKLWIGKSNCGDQNQIFERPVPKIILLAKKQVLVLVLVLVSKSKFWTLKVVCQIL